MCIGSGGWRIGHNGIAYLFLQQFEVGFVRLLERRQVAIEEYQCERFKRKAVEAMGGDDIELCFAAMTKEIMATGEDNNIANRTARAWAFAAMLHVWQMAAAFGIEKTPAELKETLKDERIILKKSKRPEEPDEKHKFLQAFDERVADLL
jgi:ATP-dependent RNA helicase DDX31/DBP7